MALRSDSQPLGCLQTSLRLYYTNGQIPKPRPRCTESETGGQDQETVFLTSTPGHSDARDHQTTLCRKRCLIAYGENEQTHVLSWTLDTLKEFLGV